jgi:hypothetical protein
MVWIVCICTSLAFFISVSAFGASNNKNNSYSLLSQAESLPLEFEEYFFDVPLAVRVEVDKNYLGDALVVLSRDERLTLIDFTDSSQSLISPDIRDNWLTYLQAGRSLGVCEGTCPEKMLALHYDLESSLLSIVTESAEHQSEARSYYEQPEVGSTGLIVRNQLNLNGGQEQNLGGRYGFEASSSLGNWTQTVNMQFARMGDEDNKIYHALHELYNQRELGGTFVRVGYFMPTSEGLTRQPRAFGASPDNALGVMYGSSDSLAIGSAKPSVYPIYVTASRQASVEIYRNGLLINTQPVAAGLQTLDTRPLPSGIYEIEVRLIEDGQTTSATDELVYKPNNWRNYDERWRYNIFAGRETKLLSNWEEEGSGKIAAGAAINYLVHPRVVLGAYTRQVLDKLQYGTSVDWTVANNVTVFSNVYKTEDHGNGLDLQAIYNYGSGSVFATHNRSWLDTSKTYETLPDGTRIRKSNLFIGQASNSSISINHRLNSKRSINARVFHSDGYSEGVGLDIGWSERTRLFNNDANWRFSVFDRPGNYSSGDTRNRGVDLSVSLALGSSGDQLSGSVGTRTSRDGGRDNNMSLTYRKELKDHVLQSVSATAISDTYGVGMSGLANFSSDVANGDAFIQRSSYNGNLSGGLNLDSTIAFSGEQFVMTSQHQGNGAGMIVDVETELDELYLRADDLSGSSSILRPGRNFIPINAYKSSSVSFDFEGSDVPAASIRPARTNYHLNKGGVEYRKINISKTLTVLGRLVDAQGKALKGHHIINHASRGVSEVDGFFSMEMNANSPTLEVRSGNQLLCQFRLDPARARREDDVLLIGDLRCTSDTLANSTLQPKAAG